MLANALLPLILYGTQQLIIKVTLIFRKNSIMKFIGTRVNKFKILNSLMPLYMYSYL